MKHTPYGYRIVNGVAVINEDEAERLKRTIGNYLSGMSLVASAEKEGINMEHSGVKHMISNPRYLGNDFYPAIITKETARAIEEERLRREKALGRDKGKCCDYIPVTIGTVFRMPPVEKKYDDPIAQAEYAYSLIEREGRE